MAVWRPSEANWYIYPSSTGQWYKVQFGTLGDTPLVGDFDGDGKSDLAVWRSSEANWYILPSSTWQGYKVQWGITTDTPLVGDFDGDGKSDLVLWRASEANWYILPSSGGPGYSRQWGISSDTPIVGDFDGDGKSDVAVWRSSEANWYIYPSSTGQWYKQQWGVSGDIPIPNQTERATITGQVLSDGSGLPGVSVILSGTTAAGTGIYLSTTTDSAGNYTLRIPPGGTYTVTLSNAGYTFYPSSFQANSTTTQTVNVAAAPTASLSGSIGVPLGGSSTYTLQMNSPQPITLVLIGVGSGAAVFSNGSSQISMSQPGTISVTGVSVSTSADDVELIALSSNNIIFSRLTLSVVHVDISFRTSGSFSADDTATKPASNLGPAQIVTAVPYGPYCASVVEYVGEVTPANYRGKIILSRSLVAQPFTDDVAGDLRRGDDTSQPMYRVDTPTQTGHIYDIDAPGVYPPAGSQTSIGRIRQNFTEYALLDDNETIVSGQLITFQRSSCVGIFGTSGQFSTMIPGDNTAGLGTTNISWDLQ